ncbi:efflux RND transporter periplasmic adaptor subunit [Actimicrobium sp. CCI2.3]|uniref:efflux RND transporter periplasmic adaptor subunit n=1 Tax=Actimicrobium sp. CCI2.3 TaxID=3048616 RepID=UPI002AB362E4|nr:efflux RND transporter periplasmic adaptor subunit [Actimicrobium sp. CCI2.3]MDY7573817.1 efflux RND transporter periplasmic adaptor subunit [Actimicrobium sp. CCI2.3]MEB0022428.1 efflux RND transporter periplasmic adaptor subunit [Actimicrobium sp. CCI2.3]
MALPLPLRPPLPPVSASARRRIMLVLLVLLLAAGLFFGFRPRAIEVDLGTVQRAPLRVRIEQEGRTRVVDRYVVAAPVNGYARRIALEIGDPIARGATLVELEPVRAEVIDERRRAEAEARIAAARSTVGAAEQRASAAASSASLASNELARARTLRLAGYTSQAAEERATSDATRSAAELQSANFAVATARHELEIARTALKYAASSGSAEPVVLRAPVDGRVLKIARKSEGTVAAGQPVIEIGDPRALEVEVDVLSADAVRLHPGMRVVFEHWGGDGELAGRVRRIEPVGFTKVSALGVEEQRVWVIVGFDSAPSQWQRLGDGYRVEASFIVWESADVLQIPASALFRDGERWAVFVVDKGKAVRRVIDIGQRNGLQAQVLSGLQAGEQVIVHPDDRVHDGSKVAGR